MLQAMVFITVLLFIFAYIFAIVGVMFFQSGYKDEEKRKELLYPDSFRLVSTSHLLCYVYSFLLAVMLFCLALL